MRKFNIKESVISFRMVPSTSRLDKYSERYGLCYIRCFLSLTLPKWSVMYYLLRYLVIKTLLCFGRNSFKAILRASFDLEMIFL